MIQLAVPHASVAVAVPKSSIDISQQMDYIQVYVVVPVVVIVGGVRSAVHVTVLDAVEVLPQASLAVNVLVCDTGTSCSANSYHHLKIQLEHHMHQLQ